ncbi:MAG: twin-arginine translocase subunit TatC [Actinomycetota bacterium]
MKLPNPFKRGDDGPEIPPGEMTLLGHLTELRKRLIRSVLAIVVGAMVVWGFNERILDFLQEPYCEFQEENGRECELLVTAPLEGFGVVLTLAGYGGLILALPVVLYQLARFVLPGLYPHEKRALLPMFLASIVLLAAGVTTAYLLLPRALGVLQEFGSDSFVALFRPSEYLGFLVKMVFAFGIAAEFPLVLIFLQKIGIVQTETLAKNRRFAAVGVVILGAIITPTGDPFSLIVLSVPMYLFYEIAIIIGKRMKKTGPPQPVGVG